MDGWMDRLWEGQRKGGMEGRVASHFNPPYLSTITAGQTTVTTFFPVPPPTTTASSRHHHMGLCVYTTAWNTATYVYVQQFLLQVVRDFWRGSFDIHHYLTQSYDSGSAGGEPPCLLGDPPMCDVTLRPGSPGTDTGPSRWTLFTLSWPPPHVPEMGRWLPGGGGVHLGTTGVSQMTSSCRVFLYTVLFNFKQNLSAIPWLP